MKNRFPCSDEQIELYELKEDFQKNIPCYKDAVKTEEQWLGLGFKKGCLNKIDRYGKQM